MSQVLEKKNLLLVQILKEPISTKGHRLSCEITIPGRFIVLTPFSNAIAISKKSQAPMKETGFSIWWNPSDLKILASS